MSTNDSNLIYKGTKEHNKILLQKIQERLID